MNSYFIRGGQHALWLFSLIVYEGTYRLCMSPGILQRPCVSIEESFRAPTTYTGHGS